MHFLILTVAQLLLHSIAREQVLHTHGCKKGVEKEKRHPSQWWVLFSVPPVLCSYDLRWQARVWGRIRFTFTICPTLLVTTFAYWKSSTVSLKKTFKVLSLNLHLTLTLQLNVTVSVPCLCHVFDSWDLLNSSLRNVHKVGRENNNLFNAIFWNSFPLLPVAPFLSLCPTLLQSSASLPQDSTLNVTGS